MRRINVLIVDDHPLIRLGVRQVLDATEDIRVVAEADSGNDALRLVARERPDVVVLDLAMAGRSGVEILKRIVAEERAPPVLIYSRFPEEQYAVRCVQAGAAGYLMKSAAPGELLVAIRNLAAGSRYLSTRVTDLYHETSQAPVAAPHEALSEREFEVFRLIVSGRTVSQIAAELALSVKTISTHRTRILQKLGLSGTADLVRYALEHGIDDSN